MGSPYKAKRVQDRLRPRDSVFLHLGTSYADEGLYSVSKTRRGRLGNRSYCAVVNAK